MGRARVLDISTISKPEQKYCGWPTLGRRKNGELLVVCSGGRESHVCPFGQVHLLRSPDGGATWEGPEIVVDGPLDDRDAGVIETGRGTIIVNWFTSVAWVQRVKEHLDDPSYKLSEAYHWAVSGGREKISEIWKDSSKNLEECDLSEEHRHWIVRSRDGGLTWSEKIDSVAGSPHGPVELSDGRLFYAGKPWQTYPDLASWPGGTANAGEIGAAVSEDDGLTWKWLSTVSPAPGHSPAKYHELHAAEAAPGRIIIQIRNHNRLHENETLQCESSDGGMTWSEPRSIGVWGYPSHLVRLEDGRILMTYGHRRSPVGVQARISTDNGAGWSEAMVVYGEGETTDLGYPSTVETGGGRLATAWYERTAENPYAVLKMAVWEIA